MSAKRRPTIGPFRPMPTPAAATIEIVDQAAAEEADFIVCLRLADAGDSLPFLPTNRIGRCSKCNERVISSATAPKKPPRLCLACYVADIAKAAEDPDAEPKRMIVTQTALDEVREGIKRQINSTDVPFRDKRSETIH